MTEALRWNISLAKVINDFQPSLWCRWPGQFLVVVTAFGVAGGLVRTSVSSKIDALRATVSDLRRESMAPSQIERSILSVEGFVAQLPQSAAIEPVFHRMQRVSNQSNVSLVSLTSSLQHPTERTLGRSSMSVTLQGTYPNIKNVLSDSFYRYPEVQMQTLSCRRRLSASEIECRVEMALLFGPLMVAEREGAGR